MTGSLLSVRGLSVELGTRRSRTRILYDIDLDIARGETLGLIGESGSGKTTLGRALVGLLPTSGGAVRFEDEELARGSRRLDGRMQMVFQDPYSSLNPALRVGDLVAEPLRVRSVRAAEVAERVRLMLDRVGLPASAKDLYPAQFSGGQRQRIAIARALITRPRLVVCDEATSALDLSVQAQILDLLRELQREFGQSYLFIGHNIDVVRSVSHRIAVLNRGRLVETAPAPELVLHPTQDYTRRLLAATLSPDPRVQAERRRARIALVDRDEELADRDEEKEER
ncbi:MAG: ATP-binding cassette domain-containing protein [Microbacterium sp.]|uniref:ATP-binding cassette domain-containing protein n=1 Tax=Microbacterium sp. TaxID=51671 RepID=UPI0039E3C4F6